MLGILFSQIFFYLPEQTTKAKLLQARDNFNLLWASGKC